MGLRPGAAAGRPKNGNDAARPARSAPGETPRFVWRDDAVRYPERPKELSENEPKRMGSGAP